MFWRVGLRSVCALWAALLGCGGELAPLSSRSIELPPVFLETVVFEGYSGRSREVEVHATRARIDTGERMAYLEGVRISFRDPDRGPVAIRAERGTLDLDADDFVLHGQVEGRVGDDERFSTAEVRYDAERERVWTDRPVRVTRQDLLLQGEGLEIDLRERKLTIRGRVRATIAGGG